MSDCTPSELVQAAACLQCIPPGMLSPVQIKLLCEIKDKLAEIQSDIDEDIDPNLPVGGYDDLLFPAASLSVPGGTSPGELIASSGRSGDQAALRLTPTTNKNNFWFTCRRL